ncbi:MAG: hypothetical protein ABIO57_01065 [Candidatus Paceibacterota bacterium]
MNIPEEDRENDQEKMNKEAIHEHNKEEAHKAHAHENPNPHLGNDTNPKHNGIGGR